MGKNFSKYRNIILEVAQKFYSENNDNPRKVDYCSEVVKLYNAKSRNDTINEEQARYQISRIIDQLSEGTNNPLLCINGKYYVRNKMRYLRHKITEEYYSYLKDRIIVLRKDILKISYNMCAVLMEPKDKNEKIVKIVSECLGENCFKVIKSKDMVLILIKSNPNKNYVPPEKSKDHLIIMKAIENAVSRIYEDQEKEGLKPLKRQRKKKQEKNDESENVTVGT